MERTRMLAAGTLLVTALVHLSRFVAARSEPETPVIVAFGAMYLILGLLLVRRSKAALYGGAILPLIGLVLATAAMLERPSPLGAFFIAADAVIIACCVYLLAAPKKSPPHQERSHAPRRECGMP